MRILIAEDDADSLQLLQIMIGRWGFEAVPVQDGAQAWEILQREDAPLLALLDVMMPHMDGLEVCRRAKELQRLVPIYIIILTARTHPKEVVSGLEAGADDYLTKPFDPNELRARIKVGERILELQGNLAMRVGELEEALSRVKQLHGLLPICSYCKKIRDDQNYWQQVESYIARHSEAQFSHSICPECYAQFVTPDIERFKSEMQEKREERKNQ